MSFLLGYFSLKMDLNYKPSRNILIFTQNGANYNEKCVSISQNGMKDSHRRIIIMSQVGFPDERSECFNKPINIHGIPRHVLEEVVPLKKLALYS